MLQITDYSSRRGVIVPLLPQIHALMTENALKDKMSGLAPPENYILWKQNMHKILVDIKRRWLFVIDGESVAGLLFYHFDDEGKTLYIDELQIAWKYRYNETVFNLLMDKFQTNREVKSCVSVYAGERIKNDADKELLASVGFKEIYPGGWQPLGAAAEAVSTFRLRYLRK